MDWAKLISELYLAAIILMALFLLGRWACKPGRNE